MIPYFTFVNSLIGNMCIGRIQYTSIHICINSPDRAIYW
ncbi:unnamed protein product [Schistosoma curassoni]|uniref:Uncharacterized protein n=1 Tax=Schistosoma curassoni TaxID=6186 RepID=A0A183KB25_9TREM|nr:unnamed protein product [Schistosoma curassoni]